MDPFTVATGVAGLISLILDVSKISYKFVSGAKNASRHVHNCLKALNSLQGVLLELQGIDSLTIPVFKCEAELAKIKAKLEHELVRSNLAMRLTWPFKEEETKDIIGRLHAFRDDFHALVSTKTMRTTIATLDEVRSMKEDRTRDHLLTWLSSYDHTATHNSKLAEAEPGTGKWLFEEHAFESWIDGQDQLLWLSGKPGTGKSVLTSLLIQNQERLGQPSIYFHFNHLEPHSLTQVLRSLIKQASPATETVQSWKDASQEPNVRTLTTSLISLVKKRQLFIALDAIDECAARREMFKFLKEILSAGISACVSGRDLPDINQHLSSHLIIVVEAHQADLTSFLSTRFDDLVVDISEDLRSQLIESIITRASGIFLIARLLVDAVSESASVKEAKGIVQSSTCDLSDLYEASLDRALKARHGKLTRKAIQWVSSCRRILTITEFRHALAIEPGSLEFDSENLAKIDLILSSCMGLLVASNGYVSLIHLTAYEYFRDRFEQQPLAIDCLTYLGYSEVSLGSCKSVQEMQQRIVRLPFLDYSAKYWHHHVSSEASLIEMILPLIEDDARRASITQAFYYRRYSDASLEEAVFEKTPTRRTALHLASIAGLSLTVTRLLKGQEAVEIDSEGQSPLHLAAMFGNDDCVKVLLNVPSINEKSLQLQDKTGWTPIFWAAMKNRLTTVELLVKEGAGLSVLDRNGWSVLDWVAFKDEPIILNALLKSSKLAELGHSDRYGQFNSRFDSRFRWKEMPEQIPRVLTISAAQNNDEAFRTMVNHFDSLGDHGDEEPRGRRHQSYRDISEEHVEHIIESMTRARSCGPDTVSIFDRQQSSLMTGRFTVRLLDYVIRAGNTQLLESLLQATNCLEDFSNNDSWRRTPMHIAAFSQDPEISRILLRHGAVISQDGNGVTPLQIACRVGSREVVDLLFPLSEADDLCLKHIWHNFLLLGHPNKPLEERGSSSAHRYSYQKESITNKRLQEIYADQVMVADKLLNAGVDAQQALEDACALGNLRGVSLLLSRGASLESIGSEGKNLLHQCAENDGFTYSTDWEEKTQSYAPLVESEHIKPVSLQALLDFGASVNSQSEDGRTALHYALSPDDPPRRAGFWYPEEWEEPKDLFRRSGKFTQAECLLRNGADATLCSISGLNGFHFLAASPAMTDDQTLTLFNLMEKGQSIHAEASAVRQLKLNEMANPTPARIAILFGHIALVKELVKLGAVLPALDTMTRAFDRAIERGDDKALLWLVQSGFEANSSILFTYFSDQSYYLQREPSDDGGKYAQKYAQVVQMFNILMEHKSCLQENLAHRDKYGNTVLHEAINSGCPTFMIEQLIEHGADLMAKDRSGKLPINLARTNLKRSSWNRSRKEDNIRCLEQAMIQQGLVERRTDGKLYFIKPATTKAPEATT